jgi:hypothetical protein
VRNLQCHIRVGRLMEGDELDGRGGILRILGLLPKDL